MVRPRLWSKERKQKQYKQVITSSVQFNSKQKKREQKNGGLNITTTKRKWIKRFLLLEACCVGLAQILNNKKNGKKHELAQQHTWEPNQKEN